MATLPDINRLGCTWTPDLIAQYYSLPTTALAHQIAYRKWFDVFPKVMDTIKWDQSAETMTMVIDERPAQTYQQAFPVELCAQASTNVQSAWQRTQLLALRKKRFESPEFNWHADFKIFMKDRIGKHLKYLQEEAVRYKSVFYRTYMFHNSPTFVALGANPFIDEGAPYGVGNEAGTAGKSNSYLATIASNMNRRLGTFSIANLRKLNGYLTDANIVPMQAGMQKDNAAIDNKFGLMIESAEYEGLADDPAVIRQTNASIADFNLVNDTFKGRLINKFNVTPFERGPRIYVNNDGTIEWPNIESIALDGQFKGRPRTIDKYRQAQIGIGFVIGNKSYSIVDPGAPPKGWQQQDAKGNGLQWNGRPVLTDNFLIDCVDPNDSNIVTKVANTYGEKMKWVNEEKMGIVGLEPHNLIPFAYLRRHAAEHGLWPLN